MEENLFKKTEYALYNYKNLAIKIKSIEIDIEMLKNDITLRAINYDEKADQLMPLPVRLKMKL